MGGSMARTALPPALGSAIYDSANQLIAWDGAGLTYDANGNLASDGVNSYTWDSRNQLIQISAGGTPGANYQYDAFGRRFGTTVSGLTTNFLYDRSNVVQELGGSNASLMTGLSVDEIFAYINSSGTTSFLTDALGSTLALTGSDGSIETQYTYAPFGATSFNGPASANSFQFTGRENDGAGLYYYRSRYYSPVYGRFVSEDRLRLGPGDSNFYAYASNSPTNLGAPQEFVKST
jgi:RHS repeat-associated protein